MWAPPGCRSETLLWGEEASKSHSELFPGSYGNFTRTPDPRAAPSLPVHTVYRSLLTNPETGRPIQNGGSYARRSSAVVNYSVEKPQGRYVHRIEYYLLYFVIFSSLIFTFNLLLHFSLLAFSFKLLSWPSHSHDEEWTLFVCCHSYKHVNNFSRWLFPQNWTIWL